MKMEFAAADRERMHALTLKHQDESLSAQKLAELDAYRRAGRVLDLMHSKSRLSLKKRTVGQ